MRITPRILVVKIEEGYQAKCLDLNTITINRVYADDAAEACVTHIFNDALKGHLALTPCSETDLFNWCSGEPQNLDSRFNVYGLLSWQFEGFAVRVQR